jgi:hypothetical protein
MKISLVSCIMPEDGKMSNTIHIKKHFESNIIPHVGDMIEDPLYKDPYEMAVTEVIINYNDNICTVSIEPIKVLNEYLDMYRKAAQSHGWNVL